MRAIIIGAGRGSRLMQLTDWRAKPAVPFGGKFRIIDFVLSNCVNSGIRRVSIMTQYKAHSLVQHIQRGWGYLRGEFDEFVEVIPAQQQVEAEPQQQCAQGSEDDQRRNHDARDDGTVRRILGATLERALPWSVEWQ